LERKVEAKASERKIKLAVAQREEGLFLKPRTRSAF
jgi:hypothetical protein